MLIKGTIEKKMGWGYYLTTPTGKYKIHVSQEEFLGISEEHCGLFAEGEDAPEIVSPKEKDVLGWVKNGSLKLV